MNTESSDEWPSDCDECCWHYAGGADCVNDVHSECANCDPDDDEEEGLTPCGTK